jgi:hypothetical protein
LPREVLNDFADGIWYLTELPSERDAINARYERSSVSNTEFGIFISKLSTIVAVFSRI